MFENSKKALLKIPGIGPTVAKHITRQDVLKEAEQEISFIEKHRIQALFYLDEAYPSRLKQIYDAPIMLYFSGKGDLNKFRMVSIVGTRKPTLLGITLCEELIEGLQPYGVSIVSGLAYGIDIVAHRQALNHQMETIGVLGHGLDRIYPAPHRTTARQMINRGGLLTEYSSHTEVDARHFPMRNRIIAALCDALVVIETGRKGGSMISAEMANGYNKDVFALPGHAKSQSSAGCNYLIKSHKAALIESAEDLVKNMRWEEIDASKAIQPQLFTELEPEEKALCQLFNGNDEMAIDRLIAGLGKSSSEMASLLLQLEFKGVIRSLPGKRYVLAR